VQSGPSWGVPEMGCWARSLDVGRRYFRRRAAPALRACPIALVLIIALVAAPAASATPSQDIASAGPLTDIWIGNDLSCQIAYAGDASNEFYPPSSAGPADCGTFLSYGGTLYAPDFA